MSEAVAKPSKGRILAVDDTAASLRLLTEILSAEGYDVRPAISGELALRAAAIQPPDLILLDIRMPGMDGLEVCQRLKSDASTHNVPVIFLSALSETDDKVKGFELGAVDYLTKPYQREELLVRVRTHLELSRLRLRLEAAHNQLLQSEKMASLGQLAAGVAHEINNPVGFVSSNLGTLRSYAERLLALLAVYDEAVAGLPAGSPLRAKVAQARAAADAAYLQEDMLALIAESSDGVARVRRIVRDLSTFSHADSSEWVWADLHECLDSTLNLAANEIKHKAEVVKAYGAIPEVECFPSQLNQVFLNLVVNAAQAIDGRGTITVRTGSAGNEVWIEIADTGSGIAPENLNRIFDPFFTTKPVGAGTGLGLSISYGIVAKHHGRIEVASQPGQGATFRVVLPVRQPAT